MKVILSAGHSPRKSGAFALGTKEHTLNSMVVDRVREYLKAQGVDVEVLDPMSSLEERVKFLQSLEVGTFVAIEFHHNVFNGKARGSEVFYKAGDKRAFDLGSTLLTKVCERLGLKNRGMKLASASARGSLAWVKTQGCLLWEVCFMDNTEDKLLVGTYETFAKTLGDTLMENPR